MCPVYDGARGCLNQDNQDVVGSADILCWAGAGKTLTVHAVVRACCQDMAKGAEAAPVSLSINCMTLASPQAVFARLLDGVQAAAQLPLKPQPDDSDPFIQPGDHPHPLK